MAISHGARRRRRRFLGRALFCLGTGMLLAAIPFAILWQRDNMALLTGLAATLTLMAACLCFGAAGKPPPAAPDSVRRHLPAEPGLRHSENRL